MNKHHFPYKLSFKQATVESIGVVERALSQRGHWDRGRGSEGVIGHQESTDLFQAREEVIVGAGAVHLLTRNEVYRRR